MSRLIDLAILPFHIWRALRNGGSVTVSLPHWATRRQPEQVQAPQEQAEPTPDLSGVIAMSHFLFKDPQQKIQYVKNVLEANGFTGKVYTKGAAIMVSDLRPTAG